MKTVILDKKTLGDDIDVNIFDGDVKIYDVTAPCEVEKRVCDAQAIIVNKVRLGEENLKNAGHLKIICVAATGYDNIDIDYCKSRGIAVCNVCGYSTDSVAQLTASMALELIIHLRTFTDFVASGQYAKSGVANRLSPVYHELSGKVWGIVGMGNIGGKVAKIAESFGCRVVAFKKNPVSDFECVSLDELMSVSDIISVHLPLTDQTRGIISRDMISKMKSTAILINVARGAVTDEEALCLAVENGDIAGLGVDVYSKEPFFEGSCFDRIKNLPNVVLTPHIAWGAYEARIRCLEEIKKNIDSFVKGEKRNRIV